MGTPGLSWVHRTDNKSYRIQTPQAPIVHNQLYRDYEFDTYPQGMNSVVAVISYTGYVMRESKNMVWEYFDKSKSNSLNHHHHHHHHHGLGFHIYSISS